MKALILIGVGPDLAEARAVLDRLTWNLALLLQSRRVHGDFSPTIHAIGAAGRKFGFTGSG